MNHSFARVTTDSPLIRRSDDRSELLQFTGMTLRYLAAEVWELSDVPIEHNLWRRRSTCHESYASVPVVKETVVAAWPDAHETSRLRGRSSARATSV